MNLNNKTFFCSWSGGKDSCLSLYKAISQGGIPKKLLTMLIENGERSRSHGLSIGLLKKQAKALNIPLMTCATSWADYEQNFLVSLREIKKEEIHTGVFGDIDIEDHKQWVQRVCKKADVVAKLPLWQRSRGEIVTEFIESGFKAVIVAVADEKLGPEFLGLQLDHQLLDQFGKLGIDPAGENGEYHTVVTGGPLFKSDIPYSLGEKILRSGYWFQDITVG